MLATSQCMDSVPEDDMEAIAELIDAALALARADWLVRTQCGLRRFYCLLRVLRRGCAGADLRKPSLASSWSNRRPADATFRGSAHLIGSLLQVGLASLGRGFSRSHG